MTFVDAAPVRAHVRWLQDSGIGIQRIIDLSGIGEGTIGAIMYGPTRHTRAASAAAILAIRPGMDTLAPGARIDAVGTRRRLQALAAIGWPSSVIGERIDRSRSHITGLRVANSVTVRVAQEVARLYQRMYYVRPQPVRSEERGAVTSTLTWAVKHGWAPPMAWTEATIDDPKARPRLAEASLLRDGLTVHTERGTVDMVAVLRRLGGDESAEIYSWEREAAVLAMYRRGRPTYEISRVTSLNPAEVNKVLAKFCPTFTPEEEEKPDRYRRRMAERVLIDGCLVHLKAPHGKKSGYVHWACRCTPCLVANRSKPKAVTA
jgi:hypothetical protein